MKHCHLLILLLAAPCCRAHPRRPPCWTTPRNTPPPTPLPDGLQPTADQNSGYSKIASAFTTGAADATLNSVSLLLNPSYNISLSSSSLTVAIYSDTTALSYYLNEGTGLNNGNITKTAVSHPLLQVGLLTSASSRPNPASAGTPLTYSSAAGISLSANTTYWIVVSSTDSSGYYSLAVDAPLTTAPASFTSGLTTDWSVRSGTTAASVDFAVYTQYATTPEPMAPPWRPTAGSPLAMIPSSSRSMPPWPGPLSPPKPC